MRENMGLYRGKRTGMNEWIEGCLVYHETKHYTSPHCYIVNFLENTEEKDGTYTKVYDFESVVSDTVGRFTGLVDKNGAKVFEGDILDAPVTINQARYGDRQYYAVGMLDGQYILTVRYIPKIDLALPDGYQFGYLCKILNFGVSGYMADDIKVIGNVHDTPGLLESAKNAQP